MDQQQNTPRRPTNPRRRKKSQIQIFKESYLPVIIGCVALLMILVFIIGSITRGIQKAQYKEQLKQEAAIAAQEKQEALDTEAENTIRTAKAYAAQFDYDSALKCIDNFSGSMADYSEMQQLYDTCTEAMSSLVLWDDPAGVLNLSFQMLIADPSRAYVDTSYGTSYNRNFVTTAEFQKILQQLYENGYVLVRLDDVTSGAGSCEIYLPEGKKPLILTQTNVNYYRYMTDSDGDWLPDAQGDGFASRLIISDNDTLTCEMVDADGNTVTGSFDLVPILESFITTHPDFSYRGARAILAVSGYDGIFGYRTSPAALEKFGQDHWENEVSEAGRVVDHLRELGYELACYSYENEPYGSFTAQQIEAEMIKWDEEVTPILGQTDIFVLCRNSDIENPGMPYSDDRFEVLQSHGYSRFLGFCEGDQSWFYADAEYIRMGRILVTGSALAHNAQYFEGMFDAATILDADRPEIPS